jgi:pimeloyl-ACP methyl ester carboxylesterase
VTSEVVLVPGLWMPAAEMALVAARLRRAGYRTRSFGYGGREPLHANIERLARFVDGGCVHFVGHSTGGVLIHDFLQQFPTTACGRVVLLGAPVRGCLAGRRLRAGAIGRWMLGACAQRWDERDCTWRRTEALGVIAGTVPLGLGRVLGRLPGENDGVVRVEETRIDGMAGHVCVRAAHSLLPVSSRVTSLVRQFLATGRFA